MAKFLIPPNPASMSGLCGCVKKSKGKLIFSHLYLCFEAAGWCRPLCKKYTRSPVPAWFLSDSPETCMLGVFVIVKCCRCEAE